MKKLYSLLTLLLISISAYAQTGVIKGNVKDAKTGEAIIGASVVIEGTTTGAVTDIEGNFTIAKVATGRYSLNISFISYKTLKVANVNVEANKTTVINTTLEEDVAELNAIEITATRQKNTEIAVITEIKQAEVVAVGISSQQISRSQDRDAAQVIQRVPGVTIVDNRYVMVRGLNERYNSVRLNGVITPSTEVDSRAFSFDIVPSNLIDRMLIYKSGSPELPGDFAGAVIDIYTKNTVDKNSTSVSFSTSYRAGTTFNNMYTYKGSATDFLGFDNGDRSLPSSFPSQNLRNIYDLESKSEASRLLPNNWNVNKETASPDVRIGLNIARRFDVGNIRINNISSVGYTYSNQIINSNLYNYEDYNPTLGRSGSTYVFHDQQGNQNIRLGIISNWAVQLSGNHKIEFRNMYNRLGNKQAIFRTGEESMQGWKVQNYALNYVSRGIYSGQLQGTHDLSDKTTVTWILGYANTKREQPDFRRARTQRAIGSEAAFEVVIPPSSSTFDAGRFYSALNENVYTFAGNIDFKLQEEDEARKGIKLKTGYYFESKERAFATRWLAYKYARPENSKAGEFAGKALEEVFAPENINPSKLVLEEGTNATDPYEASNLLAAGYAGISLPLGSKFNVNTGLRYEFNHQQLKAANLKPVSNEIGSILPFTNLAYNFTEKMLVRLAYGKTVNRPEFRELAPFDFYNFELNNNVIGNPSLKIADIHNVDLRWEIYPNEGENISLGVFYKHFNNPIENKLQPGSNPIFRPENAQSATNYGAEIELRKSFASLSENILIQNMSILLNASYIRSMIDIGNSSLLDQKRPLQGQSPYIINAGLYYNDIEHRLQINLLYNVFGKRIVLVGDRQETPTWWEMPRNVMDLTITKGLGKGFEMKFGIQDILNQRIRIFQDSNYDSEIKSKDEPIINFRRGQYTTLGLSYNF